MIKFMGTMSEHQSLHQCSLCYTNVPRLPLKFKHWKNEIFQKIKAITMTDLISIFHFTKDLPLPNI